MTLNIFERAARAKLRFLTTKGNLNTEQLFDLSLTELDTVARSVNKAIKAQGEESFIEESKSKAQVADTLRLDILKAVISAKQAAIRAAETRAENETRRRQIKEALAGKKDEALTKMSAEELEAELEKLST